MTVPRRSRWLSLGLPVAFALCAAAAVAILMLLPGAQAAEPVPEAKAGFQTTERLVLSVNLPAGERKKDGTLHVELIDAKGKVLASEEREVTAGKEATSHRFEFKTPNLAPEQITVRCTFGNTPAAVPLKKILLTKAHETALSTGQEFFVGSQASLRCEVHGVKSLSQTIPLPGAAIKVQLQGKGGKPIDLFEGKADKDGVADVQLQVPPTVAAGSYKMVVTTKSVLGEEKLERDVKVKTGPRILLVTDKPLYQPGQQIHIRALALQAFSLQPVAKSPLVFEIEDAKGNKVFKRSTTTTEHGIAHVDFQLADEVNIGDFHVRALLGEHTADKTVTVKPYVLPKFKTDLKADKKYYLPKETIHADVQVDYFFGKPVAGGKIKVTASTFDVAFHEFQTWEGKTDANGHAKLEIKLPASFVGQPLQKGDALVKLEAKVTDTADHTETITRTYPVSDQAIRVSLIPEGGRLVPGLENRIFAAALYPDGSPAKCDVQLWTGQNRQGKPFATVKTNEAGLAEFTLTPKAEQFRQGQWGQRNVEMLGGMKQVGWGPQPLFDLVAVARDDQGNTAEAKTALTSEPLGENVLLRLDKAIYKGGERLGVDVRTSAGLPTVYLDVIRSGQTLLTKWLEVKEGRARYALDLPESVFGTLEVHAYQMLGSGEIIRDSRVIYVSPANDLRIDVKADKDVYLPGGKGTIRFSVTDSNGKPTAAALGVLVVDEAVYALQEMQPGLEKVYFTLQEELLKPQVQIGYKPNERIDNLVREPVLAAGQQQVAQALLTAIKPKPPTRWNVNPTMERRQKVEAQLAQIGWALYSHATSNHAVLVYDETAKEWHFRPKLLQEMVKAGFLQANQLIGPFGDQIKLEDLTRLEKGFRPERAGRMLTHNRLVQLYWPVINYSNNHRANYLKNGEWDLPGTVLKEAAKAQRLGDEWLKDAWGHPIRLVKLKKKVNPIFGQLQFAQHELVSVGPDGKLGTDDDVKLTPNSWNQGQVWWIEDHSRQFAQAQQIFHRQRGQDQLRMLQNEGAVRLGGAPGGFGGGFPAKGAGGLPVPAMNIPRAPGAAPEMAKMDKAADNKAPVADAGPGAQAGASAPITRMREYFPETLLWQPALITDGQGHATMPIDFADSITTWRLTASASSRGGSLGGTTTPLRVFQDFFVDLDLPIALTQNDEVAFPVAVYNYLKEPQTVKLDLQQEPWFDLIDDQGFSRSLDLKPNEVTSVKFRIRAKRIGNFPLTVKAHGAKMSDATKRGIEVVPDGKKVEQVVSDRLKGTVKQTITLPETAIPDTGKLFVKVYPGVFSQILEGADGILRKRAAASSKRRRRPIRTSWWSITSRRITWNRRPC
jgi:5-hydroxyisourate hydrolase-like protein (transthyretin family)